MENLRKVLKIAVVKKENIVCSDITVPVLFCFPQFAVYSLIAQTSSDGELMQACQGHCRVTGRPSVLPSASAAERPRERRASSPSACQAVWLRYRLRVTTRPSESRGNTRDAQIRRSSARLTEIAVHRTRTGDGLLPTRS